MITVACAIIMYEGKILITQRGPQMKHPLKWEFPGGKLETNETSEQCIRREILEELNISISLVKQLNTVIHDYGTVKISLIPFLAEYKSGSIILKEHIQYLWVTPRELHQLDWVEADVKVVEQVIRALTGI